MGASASSHRLFFALQPDHRTLEALRLVQRRLDLRDGRPVPLERLHATLLFMGNQPGTILEPLREIAAELHFEPWRLVLDRLGHFPRAGVAWLGTTRVPPQLEAFQASLGRAVASAGIDYDDRPWRMHVTLYRNLRKRPGKIAFEPIEWWLRNFQLMESIQSETGLEYHCLGRWPAESAA